MLVIRWEQGKVFQDLMQERFHQRMILHLRGRCAPQIGDKSSAEVRDLIISSIEEARALGISLETDLQTYLEYYVELGPGFTENPDYPDIRALFANRNFNIDERMYELRRRSLTDQKD